MFKQLNWWQRGVAILFILVMVVTIFLGVRGIVIGTNQVRPTAPGEEIKLHMTSAASATETRLTQWVYDHSTRISRAQCQEIVREAMKYRYPELLLAIMELESIKFNPGAMSTTKDGAPLALGWCQINIREHTSELIKAGIIKEVRDLWDTGPNIRAGAYILDQKLKLSKGDIAEALSAYKSGSRDTTYLLRILSNHANLTVKQS